MSWPFALGGATGLLAAVMLAGAPGRQITGSAFTLDDGQLL